jgi:hypothetical protein
MIDGVQPRSRWLSVLTATAFIVALGSFLDRVFWWTHKQFADCAVQIGNVPQPRYCRAFDELDWMIWYGPLVSLAVSAVVLVLRRQRWHSSPFTPVVLFWLSVLMSIRTAFVMLVRFAMSDIH